MRALVLDKDLQLVEDYPIPEPSPSEALIRVRLVGICNTDLELIKGYRQFQGIPGHEFVGIVKQAPPDSDWEGQRVVGDINLACGTCPTCNAGRPTHCPNRTTLGIDGHDGAFAEYLTLPMKKLSSPSRWLQHARSSSRSTCAPRTRSSSWETVNWGSCAPKCSRSPGVS